jgi:hypothetical protein
MDLNGPATNTHFRPTHHQTDEVRLIDYARLTEHISPRKIVLLQLFRTAFRRLVRRLSVDERVESLAFSLESTLYTEQGRRIEPNHW